MFLLWNYTPGKSRETSLLGGRKAYQLTNIDNIHGDITDSVIENDDLFFPEFGFEMEHIGYLNPSLSSYLVSLKYNICELRSHTLTTCLYFITPLAACRFINKMYYNKQLNMSFCLDTLKSHVHNDQWSFYTLQIIMNIYDNLDNELENMNKLKKEVPNIADKNKLRLM